MFLALLFISSQSRAAEEYPFDFESSLSAERTFYFDLPQQPLGPALIAFARQVGLDILFEPDEVEGEKPLSTPLIGYMPVEQALSTLLSFSALEYTYTGPNTVVIRRKQIVAKNSDIAFVSRLPEVGVVEEKEQQKAFLQQRVETGMAGEVTLFEGSVSGNAVSSNRIEVLSARSTGEVIRSLPGIRSEFSGGIGNTNITLRGIPVGGGSRFLQLHEDGLPVLEFGDIVSANADNFLRFDNTVGRIESIRGGSAATFASNSPGGIVNFISKTGREAGGSVAYTEGLDFNTSQIDFEYGAPLNSSLRFHVGGFFHSGEGPRDVDFSGERGVQIKGNLTYEFDAGYMRVYGKYLDDTVIGQLPSAVRVEGGSSYGPVGGFDASRHGVQSPFNLSYSTLDTGGAPVQLSFNDSIVAKVNAVGVEFQARPGNNFIIDYKARHSEISGRNIMPLAIGIEENASNLGDAVTIAAGPGAGTAYNGLAQTHLWLDFISDSLDYSVQDLKLTKESDIITWTAGIYTSNQTIEQSWPAWVTQIVALDGGVARPLEIVSGGADITDNGIITRSALSTKLDLEYDTWAPYLNFQFDLGRVTLDVSGRKDYLEARGGRFVAAGTQDVDFNNDGVISSFETVSSPVSVPQLVNFDIDYESFSVGGNFAISNNLAVFARASRGSRIVADRIFDIGIVNLDTGVPTEDPVDNVKQQEVGVKLQGDSFELFAILFASTTDETQFEITSNTAFIRQYDASGIEVEGNLLVSDSFYLSGNLTWTDAEIASDNIDPTVIGNIPRRQADFIYTITPGFRNSLFNVGIDIQGSTEFYLQDINELKQEAYQILNLYLGANLTDQLLLSVSVSNLTDEFVLTEAEDGAFADAVNGTIRGRPGPARSTVITLRYDF